MKTYIFLSIFLLSFSAVYPQTAFFTATGKVLDSATRSPLGGASVFCQNTTFGSVTNSQGEFTMRLPNGGYDLVASYTGYGTEQLHINSTSTENISFVLKPVDKSLSEVTVSGSNEVADGLAKYGQFFLDEFIGTTPNAENCTILNPEALQFYFSKKRNRLKVKSREDLLIVNASLGYRIRYQLDSFAHDYGNHVSTYSGFQFFEEMDSAAEQKQVWQANRLNAYKGSRLHFMRSYYDSTLKEEGFVIEWIDTTKKTLTTRQIDNPYDSIYYAEVENNNVQISLPGKYRLIYRNEMPDKKFITQYNLPSTLRSQLTILQIADDFIIEENGYFYNQGDIINTGYWSWEKVAELLPYDYNPE
jgi:hypothetical protein